MGGSHSTEQHGPTRVSDRMRLFLAAFLVPLMAATVAATLLLWPDEPDAGLTPDFGEQAAELVDATVVGLNIDTCSNDPSLNTCNITQMELTSGEASGTVIDLELPRGPGQPDIAEGDKLVLGQVGEVGSGNVEYYFSDFQRGPALAVLAAIFAVLVVFVARWRGIGAILGLFITWAVITYFMLPAILEGKSPLMVALAGSAAIVLVVLYVAHGFNARTSTAVIGTLISLAATGALSAIAVEAAHISGLASEEISYVQSYAGQIDIQGLILGGFVIGALGVLNDMTVSQSSSVREIHLAQPSLGWRKLFQGGMRVGRDHIASTVYTLVLAYVGASLPLLILFTLTNREFADVLATELVAEEVIRTIVGSIGLILSVPITTALSAVVEQSRIGRSPNQLERMWARQRETLGHKLFRH
jgi:uncharacterized membrane protein